MTIASLKRLFGIATVIMIIIAFLLICVDIILPYYDFQTESYLVQYGDSLWTIASKYCPDGMNEWDYLHMVVDANNLTSTTIHPGQLLTVFVKG